MKGIIFIALMSMLLVSGCTSQNDATTQTSCQTDDDCVPGGTCCHPTECVNREFAQRYIEDECKGIFCTEVCMQCPECGCINNTCTKIGDVTFEEGGCC